MDKRGGHKDISARSVAASYCLYFCIFLLSFILYNLLITSLMFIFKVGVQPWYAFVAGFGSIITTFFILKKRGDFNYKTIFIVLILPIVAICGITALSGKFYDVTFDGNNYHKFTIGMMMDGWVPLYETQTEFSDRISGTMDTNKEIFHWGDYYAKASHIFAANIGKITGNVESGKALNGISILAVFAIFISICLYVKKSWLFSILFSVIVVTTPTISGQFLTNYVDVLVYLYMFLLVALFFGFEYMDKYRNELLMVLFMTLVMLINLKFSSFAYAGILCSFYYLWYIYRFKKETNFKDFFRKFSIVSLSAVLIGVFIVGLSVYPRNMIVNGNPFYPLMGEGRKDIMTTNSPDYFKGKSNIERFIIATFSKMDNIYEVTKKEAEYKIPFSIDEQELTMLGYSDIRISGNGVFFSGILIISVVVLALSGRRLFVSDRKLFILIALPVSMTLLMIVAMSDVWWARYFPQLHYVVFGALIILSTHKNKVVKISMYSLMILLLTNNLMYFFPAVDISREYTTQTKKQISSFKSVYTPEKCPNLVLGTNVFQGAYYDGRYIFPDYNIVYKRVNMQELDDDYIILMNPFMAGRCEKK